MKLSKAQQEVVDKMREGALIRYHGFDKPVKINVLGTLKTLNRATFMTMEIRNIIYSETKQIPRTYHLTEQYKTQPKHESNTTRNK